MHGRSATINLTISVHKRPKWVILVYSQENHASWQCLGLGRRLPFGLPHWLLTKFCIVLHKKVSMHTGFRIFERLTLFSQLRQNFPVRNEGAGGYLFRKMSSSRRTPGHVTRMLGPLLRPKGRLHPDKVAPHRDLLICVVRSVEVQNAKPDR